MRKAENRVGVGVESLEMRCWTHSVQMEMINYPTVRSPRSVHKISTNCSNTSFFLVYSQPFPTIILTSSLLNDSQVEAQRQCLAFLPRAI